MNKYYGIIYKWTNLINNKIYIGQTTYSLEERTQQHIYDAKTHRTNMLLHSAINKYGVDNFKIELIDKAYTKEELNALEKKYISLYNCCILDNKSNGYNMTYGGDSGEHRGRKVCQFDLNGTFLKEFSTITNAAKNLKISFSSIVMACQNIYKTAGGYQWCYKEDFLLKNNKKVEPNKKTNKPVIQYSLDGKMLKVWDSATEAAKANVGIRQHIYKVCKGERKQTGGFIWRYCYEEDDTLKKIARTQGQPIVQIDPKTNEIIKHFNTIAEAEKDLGIKQGKSHISDVCKNKRNTAYGYKWRYQHEIC